MSNRFQQVFLAHIHEDVTTTSAFVGATGPITGSIGPYKTNYAEDDARMPHILAAKEVSVKVKKGKKKKEQKFVQFPIQRRNISRIM